MDTLESLYQKYLSQVTLDNAQGSQPISLLAYNINVCLRLATIRTAVGDTITANQVLTFTYNNYQ